MAISAVITAARPAAIQVAKVSGIVIGMAVAYGVAVPVFGRVFVKTARATDAVLDAPGKGVAKFRTWRDNRKATKAAAVETTEAPAPNVVPINPSPAA